MGNCYSDCQYYEGILKGNSGKQTLKSKINFSNNLIIFGQDKTGADFCCQLSKSRKALIKIATPKEASFINYSAVTQKSENTLIVCGGIKYNLVGISDQSFEYDLSTNKIRRLPKMLNIRYTFPVIYKDEKIYVIGGRVYGDDRRSILKSCEMFDYKKRAWKSIGDLNVPRCTSSAIIYARKIWVFGGYTGQFERSRKVECYEENEDVWKVLSFELLHGFETGNIVAGKNANEIIVFGGKFNYGSSMTVLKYNLAEGTVLNMQPLQHDQVLSKHYVNEEGECVLVTQIENNQIVCETYNNEKEQFEVGRLGGNVLKNLIKFKQYNFNAPNLEILEQEIIPGGVGDYKDLNVIFGTDSEPFQINIDRNSGEVHLLALSLKLRICHSQGCVRLNANELLFFGGTNKTEQRLVLKSFVYNLTSKEVTFKRYMSKGRHSVAWTRLGKYVYVCGGKEGADVRTGTLTLCERYNLEKNEWEMMKSLNYGRANAGCFVFGDRVFVAGGILASGLKTETIEVYDNKISEWKAFGINLPARMSGMFILPTETVVFIGGGSILGRDSYQKYKLAFNKGDLAVAEKVQDSFKAESSENKYVYVKDKIVVFGGSKSVFIVEENDFTNFKENKSAGFLAGSFVSERENLEECMWRKLEMDIQETVGKVSFGRKLLKKNTFVTIKY